MSEQAPSLTLLPNGHLILSCPVPECDRCLECSLLIDSLRSQLAAANDSVAKAREAMENWVGLPLTLKALQVFVKVEDALADAAKALGGQGS